MWHITMTDKEVLFQEDKENSMIFVT